MHLSRSCAVLALQERTHPSHPNLLPRVSRPRSGHIASSHVYASHWSMPALGVGSAFPFPKLSSLPFPWRVPISQTVVLLSGRHSLVPQESFILDCAPTSRHSPGQRWSPSRLPLTMTSFSFMMVSESYLELAVCMVTQVSGTLH